MPVDNGECAGSELPDPRIARDHNPGDEQHKTVFHRYLLRLGD